MGSLRIVIHGERSANGGQEMPELACRRMVRWVDSVQCDPSRVRARGGAFSAAARCCSETSATLASRFLVLSACPRRSVHRLLPGLRVLLVLLRGR